MGKEISHIAIGGVPFCQFPKRVVSPSCHDITCGQESFSMAKRNAKRLMDAGHLSVKAVKGTCKEKS